MRHWVIVNMETVNVFDFMRENEAPEEAVARGNAYYQKELETVKSHSKNYGGDYWAGRVKAVSKQVKAGCKVVTYKEFTELERKHLVDGKLTEVTKEQFEDALDALSPLYWTTHGNVEMFCMREMWSGSYTTQYAHDLVNDKYYSTMVDCLDKSTWICELLNK